jgi:hypothetical protein
MAIGEDGLRGYAREQLEAARRDPRLERGHGAMIGDFGLAVEEVERTRMLNVIGLEEIRRAYEREKADFDANGGNDQREHEVQVFWQRAEMARVERENDYPAINAQALIALNSALDSLVEYLAPAVRDLPFEMRMKEAEEQLPAESKHLTPEMRETLIRKTQELFDVEEPKSLKGKGIARYERRLKAASLGAPKDRPIPKDLDRAIKEFGVIRDCLIHRASRIDARALELGPSLSKRYKDGDLVRLTGEDYRTYSAAMRCYAAEVIHRLYSKWPDLADPDDEPDLGNWRSWHMLGA